MTFEDLIVATALRSNLPGATVRKIAQVMLRAAHQALSKGDEVALPGIGKLKIQARPSRVAYNPRTKEKMQVPARNAVVFKSAVPLTKAVNA